MFGAASTSGTVLKNIALKMFSRGMLNNSSDYREGEHAPTRPTFFASGGQRRIKNVRDNLGMGSVKYF